MASSWTSKHSLDDDIHDGITANSYFQNTVCLTEWWLVMPDKDFEGNRLAVAGFTSARDKQALRTFYSAPILKRYDFFTLETVDGICIIIQGFMNKARTKENGFPSEVCDQFVFGFPPCWKICARKYSERDSTLTGIEGPSKGMTKNFDQACSEAETKEYSIRKNLGVESSSEVGKKEMEHNSDEETISSFDSNAYGASERETSVGDYSVENRENHELSGSHFNNSTEQPLIPSGLEENFVPSSIKGNANDTGRKFMLKNFKEHYKNSTSSACRLTNEKGCNITVQSLEDPCKVNSSKKLAEQIFFSREADLSEELSSYSESRGTACSQKKVQENFKNNQTSCGKLKDENIMSVSVSLRSSDAAGIPRANLDGRPRGKSTLNPPGTEFQELTDQTASRNPRARSFEDNAELDHGICLTAKDAKHDQSHEVVQEHGGMQNKLDGDICASGANGEKEEGKKKISSGTKCNLQSESLSRRKSRCNARSESLSLKKSIRKLKEKEEPFVLPPESLCVGRSRSGRLLLPSLEFWRNQRVVYDADRQIRGIKDLN